MLLKRFILLFILLVFTAVSGQSQGNLRAELLWSQVAVNQPFAVQYHLENAAPLQEMHLEPASGIIPKGGYQEGNRTSTQIINGKSTTTRAYTRTYTLQGTRSGTFQLPVAVATTTDGQTYRSQPVEITVTKNAPQQPPSDPFAQDPFANDPFFGQDPFGGDPFGGYPSSFEDQNTRRMQESLPTIEELPHYAFLEIVPQMRSSYTGQPVFVDYLLVSRISVNGNLTRMPSPDGFWVTDFTPPNEERRQRRIGNRIYETLLIKRVALLPQRSGKLTIAPAEMIANGTVRSVDGYPQPHSWNIKSAPATIEVFPLPAAGKPTGFTNATGRFQIQAVLDPPTMARNGASTLTVTISGAGNLPQIEAPVLQLPEGLTAEAPQVQDAFAPDGKSISGTRIFRYPVTASREGNFTIPAISLSFFDPENRQYNTVRSQPVTLSVTEATDESGAAPDALEKENRLLMPLLVMALLALGTAAFFAFRKKVPAKAATPPPPPPKTIFTPTPPVVPQPDEKPPVAQTSYRTPMTVREALHTLDRMLRDDFKITSSSATAEQMEAVGISPITAQQFIVFRQKAQAALYGGFGTADGTLLEEANHLLATLQQLHTYRQLHKP